MSYIPLCAIIIVNRQIPILIYNIYNIKEQLYIMHIKQQRNMIIITKSEIIVNFNSQPNIRTIKSIKMSTLASSISSSSQPPTSKLVQYLNNKNYEMAVTAYNTTPQPLNQINMLELARAYHVTQDYQKVCQICQMLKSKIGVPNPSVFSNGNKSNSNAYSMYLLQCQLYYQTYMLLIKCRYLLNKKVSSYIRQLQSQVNKWQSINTNRQNSQQFVDQSWRRQQIKQLKLFLQSQSSSVNVSPINTLSRNQIKQFGRSFRQLYQSQLSEPLIDCMPMFIVSTLWFSKFQYFVGIKNQDNTGDSLGSHHSNGNNNNINNSNGISSNSINPGPITHFQILDHRYNLAYDKLPQKHYTNLIIYPGASVTVLTKKCWLELIRYFRPIHQLKRYNVWVSGKPKQIMTEIYLKQLQVRRNSIVYQVQITKKQTWGGLNKKLRAIWRQKQSKMLMQNHQGNLRIIPESTFLQQSDTANQIFTFDEPQLKQLQSSKGFNSSSTSASSSTSTALSRCAYCGKNEDLKYCQCRTVKYCNARCQKQDREKHRKKCQLEVNHIKQKAAVLENFNLPQRSYAGKKGLVGLRNLGNTCYMNSGLQCLSNTKQITNYFMRNEFLKQINQSNPLGTKGHLACAYAQLIREMWTGSDSSISPFNLKKIIGKFASQFSGYGQQDSQQFISYLIDGLQEDLNLVKKKQTFQIPDDILPDEEASKKGEQLFEKRIKSFIRDLMVGQFKSTVICEKCNKKSVCFDPYMLLSLPIPGLKQNEVFYIATDCAEKTKKLNFSSDATTKMGQLRMELSNFYNISPKNGNFIIFSIIQLVKFQTLAFNIPDQTSINDVFNKITSPDTVLIAYEIQQPREGENTYQIQYRRGETKKCFPRFMNFRPQANSRQIFQALEKSITRYAREQSKYSRDDPSINDLVENPQFILNGERPKILINLKKNVDMLSCVSEKKKLRLQATQKQTSLYDCLSYFTHTEVLEGVNERYCNKCKKHERATKQMEIYKSNQILVVAFKRFTRTYKIKDVIEYPLEGLDLGPYILSNKQKVPILYDLYGVVNHMGTMSGGHYTAYCKNFLNNQWYQFDDSNVSKLRNPRQVISQYAYVLFYRKKQ